MKKINNTLTALTSIQGALAALGYDPGPIDGLFGPRTRKAAEAWLHHGGEAATIVAPLPGTAGGPMLYHGDTPIREIVIHCAATRPDWMNGRPLAAKVAEIRRWHVQDKGWKDIGYHWIIDREGSVMPGRAETVIGAHVAGRNRGTIGICMLGGHGSGSNDAFEAHFTSEQNQAVRALITEIRSRTQIYKISGHNEYANKACPGFNVARWF